MMEGHIVEVTNCRGTHGEATYGGGTPGVSDT
jgi:hypothetical protein